MHENRRSILILNFGVLLFGGTALFSKLITLPAIDITILRSSIAGLALMVWLLVRRRLVPLQRKDLHLMLLAGILFAVHWSLFFYSVQVSTVAVGIVTLFTHPVMVVFLEPLFAGGRPRKKDIFAASMVVAGIYLMVPEFSFANDIALGIAWGLVSALLFTFRLIIQRQYLRHYPGDLCLFYLLLVVTLVLLPFASTQAFTKDASQWGLIVLLALVFTAIPHAIMTRSLRYLSAKTTSLVNSMQVVYSILLAILILSEIPTWQTVVGGSMIVFAAMNESLTTMNTK
ncbi:DMT family transporter [Pseudomonadota bacterium]